VWCSGSTADLHVEVLCSSPARDDIYCTFFRFQNPASFWPPQSRVVPGDFKLTRNNRSAFILQNLIVSLKHPYLLRNSIGDIEDVAKKLICLLLFLTLYTYLKIAISILISRIFATNRKTVINTGGIHPPGTQFVPSYKFRYREESTGVPRQKSRKKDKLSRMILLFSDRGHAKKISYVRGEEVPYNF
jgi:hypothetical protein